MGLFINGVGQNSFTMNNIVIENLYVDNVLVWTSDSEQLPPPMYQMEEELILNEGFSFIKDSVNETGVYNGKLTESDGVTPYNPTGEEYPQNGTLLLDNNRIMDTQFIMERQRPVYQIYDVVFGVSYKIAVLEPVSEGIINVYMGDQDTPLALVYSDVSFVLPVDSWKIIDGEPSWIPTVFT